MAGRHRLGDVALAARPADAPVIHRADALRPLFAEQAGERLVAQPTPGHERVMQMVGPVVGRLLAERDRDGHLRHHRRAAAPDQAAVGEQHARTGARCFDRRIHAGAARSDDEHVGLDVHGLDHDRAFGSRIPDI